MEVAPLPSTYETPKEHILESFEIKQDENIYKLNIEIINKDIVLNILEEKDILKEYEIRLTLEELKLIHKVFLMLSSCQEFLDNIKLLIQNNKLYIKKTNESIITIELSIDLLFKQNIIKIDLTKKQISFDTIAQDLYKKFSILNEENKNIKQELKNIKEENKRLREENNEIKFKLKNLEDTINNIKLDINKNNIKQEDINNLIEKKLLKSSINSLIIEEDSEFEMIELQIENTVNKKIKSINKLYQATKDGFDDSIIHKKCDGIPNTLVLYKSKGNRRFGGFVSQSWSSKKECIADKKSFLFSLDKKKIYPPKNGKYYSLACYPYGLSFAKENILLIIYISDNNLQTNENNKVVQFFFDFQENALSEDGNWNGTKAIEFEVFEIKF